MKETIIFLKKIERQLILYKYFNSPCIKEKKDAMSVYGIPTSTIYKDLVDLRDADLVSIEYNPESREYVRVHKNDTYDSTGDKPTRVRHLERLKRLAWCMDNLTNDPTTYEYIYEDVYDSYDDKHQVIFNMGEKSCKDYYLEEFPGLSISTMQRDFRTLSRIGYRIKYNFILQKYDFFERDYEEDDPKVYGVFYDKKINKLCRRCGEGYDNEMQENYQANIEGMRSGAPVEEWEPY